MSILRGGVMRSQQALDLSQAIYPSPMHGHTGFRIIGGPDIPYDNAIPKTYRAIIEIAAPSFEAVQPIFCTMRTANGYTVAGCNARPAANFDDPVGTPTAVTLPGGGVVAAAAAANNKTFMLGDWVDLPSIPRDDGGTGAIVIFDAYISTAGIIGLCGSATTGSGTYGKFVTRERHKHRWRRSDGDCVTTPANFTNPTDRGFSPIVGVRYLSMGRIVTVMGLGDSITEGIGTIRGEGFILPACERASDLSPNITFEYANLGVGSTQSPTFSTYLDSALAVGLKPNVMCRPIGSPNDLGVPIVASNVASNRQWLANNLKTCSENGIAELLWTIFPVNPAVKNWNASDGLRVGYNADMLGEKGLSIIDLATVLSGVVDGDGQINMLVGSTDDDIHPNDYGNSLPANAVAARLLKVR